MLQELANIKSKDIYITDVRFANSPDLKLPSLLIIAPLTNTQSKTIQIDFTVQPFAHLSYEEALGVGTEYEYEYFVIMSWLEKAEESIKSFSENYYCFPFHFYTEYFENYHIPVDHLGLLTHNARIYFEHCQGSGRYVNWIGYPPKTTTLLREENLFVNSYSKRFELLDRLFLVDSELLEIVKDLRIQLSLTQQNWHGWEPGSMHLEYLSTLIQRLDSLSLIFNTPHLVNHFIFNREKEIQRDVAQIMRAWYKDHTEPPFIS